MNPNKQYRQGDVLLVSIKSLPADLRKNEVDTRIVLAYGEATGHAHAISAVFAESFFDAGNNLLIKADQGAVLVHEEHAPIPIAPGCYRVIKQKEYVESPLTDWDAMAMD